MAEQYYGIYRGTVVDIDDPSGRRRIRALVPAVLGQVVSPWALPCMAPGLTTLPPEGARVWIAFEGGDPNHPIWLGTLGMEPGEDSTFRRGSAR